MSTETLKKKIRAATIGSPTQFKTEIVKYNGVEIEVRQLSIAGRNTYLQTGVDPETNKTDINVLQANAIIASCYVPGTDEKLFDESDINSIKSSVSGGYADDIWEAVQRLGNIKPEEAKKN